jgi:hypothetical protein
VIGHASRVEVEIPGKLIGIWKVVLECMGISELCMMNSVEVERMDKGHLLLSKPNWSKSML